jgi:predicted glycosyltransferase involved in capsule biosynthesis
MVLAGYTGQRRFVRTVSEWDDMRWAELPKANYHHYHYRRYYQYYRHHNDNDRCRDHEAGKAWVDVGRAWTKLFVCVCERAGCVQG